MLERDVGELAQAGARVGIGWNGSPELESAFEPYSQTICPVAASPGPFRQLNLKRFRYV